MALKDDLVDTLALLQAELKAWRDGERDSAPPLLNRILELTEELAHRQAKLIVHCDAIDTSLKRLSRFHKEHTSRYYDFALCGYMTLSPKGTIRRINHTAASLLSAEIADLKSKRLEGFVESESRPNYLNALASVEETRHARSVELKLMGDLDRQRWVSVNIQGVWRKSGKLSEWRLVLNDITERKIIEENLLASKKLYQNLFENVEIGVSMISPDMEILQLNRQMKKWFPAIDPAEQPKCYRAFNDPPKNKICSYCPTHKTLGDGGVHESITETPTGNGIRHYKIISSPILNARGDVIAAIEMVDDITEQKLASAQIRNLSHKLIMAQESERLMISRELHDNLAQELIAAKIQCDSALQSKQRKGARIENTLGMISNVLTGSIAAVRQLSYDLRPPGLNQFGIIEALRQYCREFSKTRPISVEFHSGGFSRTELNEDISINIYRLVQEGLSNVMKHAEASSVTIRLFYASPSIVLTIDDDGKGFDVRKREAAITSEKKLGLRSMKERIDILHGKMQIKSSPGAGTRLRMTIPYSR